MKEIKLNLKTKKIDMNKKIKSLDLDGCDDFELTTFLTITTG
jgi:hypothetical protein